MSSSHRKMALKVVDILVGQVVQKDPANHVTGNIVLLGFTKKLQDHLAQFMLDLRMLGLFLFDAKPDKLIKRIFRIRPRLVQWKQKST